MSNSDYDFDCFVDWATGVTCCSPHQVSGVCHRFPPRLTVNDVLHLLSFCCVAIYPFIPCWIYDRLFQSSADLTHAVQHNEDCGKECLSCSDIDITTRCNISLPAFDNIARCESSSETFSHAETPSFVPSRCDRMRLAPPRNMCPHCKHSTSGSPRLVPLAFSG